MRQSHGTTRYANPTPRRPHSCPAPDRARDLQHSRSGQPRARPGTARAEGPARPRQGDRRSRRQHDARREDRADDAARPDVPEDAGRRRDLSPGLGPLGRRLRPEAPNSFDDWRDMYERFQPQAAEVAAQDPDPLRRRRRPRPQQRGRRGDLPAQRSASAPRATRRSSRRSRASRRKESAPPASTGPSRPA